MKKIGFSFIVLMVLCSIVSYAYGSYVAHLSGEQEVPVAETEADGQAVFHLNENEDALEYKIIVANLENITMAHIHNAPAGQNGGVVAWLYPSAPPAMLIPGVSNGTLAEGSISESDLVGDLEGQTLSALLDMIKSGKAYVNIHTEQYPGGEIRGQIMMAPSVMFKAVVENISEPPEFSSSGFVNTPVGATEPGILTPGNSYVFSLGAAPGSKLSFASMFAQSNDLFYAPDEMGIPLFNGDGTPMSGDVTSYVALWDAGTEVNQKPGVGPDQAPRQAGPDTGADENGVVQHVNDGYTYPDTADVLSVMVNPMPDNQFEISINNISSAPEFSSSGAFNTPEGATEPGVLTPGSSYKFNINAAPGSKLSIATMYVQSNDLFYAPDEMGIPLFDENGMPMSGDVTSYIMLWDAGTEVNQEPGVGMDQAPRQAGPDTGADENGVVQPIDAVNDGFTYPNTADSLSVMITHIGESEFEVSIDNISADSTFVLSPGVWVVHSGDAPIFNSGQPDRGEGLEDIAEDGNPDMLASELDARSGILVVLSPAVWVVHTEDAPIFTSGQPDRGEGLEDIAEDGSTDALAASLDEKSGITVVLSPGVWAVHTEDAPIFTSGQPDRGEGLEDIAEDGNPAVLAPALSEKVGIISSGVFNTPVGTEDPAPAGPGSKYEFHFKAFPGTKLSLASMFVQSNDLFYAPDEMGISLFNSYGGPVSGDVTSYIMLWDAGTEVNQQPGVGPDQAPRQSGPDTGADENGVVQLVNDGYTYPDTLTSIRVTISVMPMEEPPEKDYSKVFFMDLATGLNMISLPLEPQEAYTARSLAEMLEATVVIDYDTDSGRFVGFTPASPGDGFMIKGGKGYIINRMTSGVVTFTGAAWENEPHAEAAPPMMMDNSAWAFVVAGKTDSVSDSYTVSVRNLRTDAVTTTSTAEGSSFAAVFADLNRNPVIQSGDSVEIIISDNTGNIVAGPVVRQINGLDIQRAFVDIVVPFGQMTPKKTALMQNYPNPFNPETWIPFQLSESADVSVSIYDSTGKLVRVLDLGHRDAGIYTNKKESLYWDGKNSSGEHLASGIYFYTLRAGNFVSTRKMTILK
jgi:hypothetical protein